MEIKGGLRNNGSLKLKMSVKFSQTVNSCVWLRKARMAMYCSVKNEPKVFTVFLESWQKSLNPTIVCFPLGKITSVDILLLLLFCCIVI